MEEITNQNHRIVDLAANQLETAIKLFVNGVDYFSAVTLAGAADVIFAQLVLRSGKKNFTDHLIEQSGDPRSREEFGKELNDDLHINSLKHLDSGEDGYITLNPYQCALTAILKALTNYSMLKDKKQILINAFLLWVQENLDPKKYNIYCDPDWISEDIIIKDNLDEINPG